jgi:lipoprotein-releasing system permease protein
LPPVSFEWFIARRYLLARRKQALVSLISGVSIVGVTVGVMALIIALALMTGVQGELRDRIVGSTAHVYVYKLSDQGFEDVGAELRRFSSTAGVTGAAPAIIGQAMISAGRDAQFVTIKGIDAVAERRVTDIDSALRSGGLARLVRPTPDSKDGLILGEDLAKSLGVAVGDSVSLITPEGTLTPFGALPRSRTVVVAGTFRFGYYAFDNAYAFMSLDAARSLFHKGEPDLIQLRLRDMDQAPRVKAALQAQLGAGYMVQDWIDLNGSLYSALLLEKIAISLTIGLIVVVAALNIVASLVLLVMEKSHDIAILRTMGAPARAIRRIFMLQGLTIGLIGTGAGTILGLLISYVADHYRLISLPADIYQITYLPFRVLPLDVAVVVASGILICFAATIYPARQAGRLDPAEALRQ